MEEETEPKEKEPETVEGTPIETAGEGTEAFPEKIATGEPIEPSKEPPIEECDPMTMNCNEMPKAMAQLTKRSETLGTGLKKLEEIDEIMPSEEGKQLYTKTTAEKANVDGKIQDIVLRFSKCRLYEEEETPPPPATPPES